VSLTVLTHGIDTLEASFMGEIRREQADAFDEAKELAQRTDTPTPVELGLLEFFVRPKGLGKWRWRLTNEYLDLRLSSTTKRPSAQVRFPAFALAYHGPEALMEWTRLTLSAVGAFEPYASLSRVDVYADFQGFTPTLDVMRHLRSRSRFRPVYPNTDTPETFQYGKGQMVLRVYDKTKEYRKSGKDWLPQMWSETGRYDSAADVWRAEVQLRRAVLKELDYGSAGSAIQAPGPLFDYGLSENRLRLPIEDENKSRWPEHPVWTQLREYVGSGVPLSRLRAKPTLMGVRDVRSRLIGMVATYAAHMGIPPGRTQYMDALQRLSYDAEVYMHLERIVFADIVESKRRRMKAEC
jgi:hypothetical protein